MTRFCVALNFKALFVVLQKIITYANSPIFSVNTTVTTTIYNISIYLDKIIQFIICFCFCSPIKPPITSVVCNNVKLMGNNIGFYKGANEVFTGVPLILNYIFRMFSRVLLNPNNSCFFIKLIIINLHTFS